jgi:hypothetical protein
MVFLTPSESGGLLIRTSLIRRKHAARVQLPFSRFKAALLVAFALLQIADVITTQRVLGNGGWEANPLGVFAMAHFGNYWPIPKLALMTLCAAVMLRWKSKSMIPFVALMGIVVANNAFWAYS